MMLSIAVATLLQAAAPGAPTTQPDWARRPDANDIMRVYPEAAQKQRLVGRATIRCSVTTAGTLAECSVVNEDPVGADFGLAALRASVFFKMHPRTENGAPVDGGTVMVPIRFALLPDAQAGAVVVNRSEFKGIGVEVNCRYQGGKLDNCFVQHFPRPPAAASEAALAFASGLTLPDVPRPIGRVLVPVSFAPDVGASPTPDDIITNPVWLRRPTGADMARLYPIQAMRYEAWGRATTMCTVTAEGTLTACEIVLEDPTSIGFAQATLALMPLFQMKPTSADGMSVGGHKIKIPVRWVLPRR